MQDDIPKQRGIYSEILTTDDPENLKVSSTLTSRWSLLLDLRSQASLLPMRSRRSPAPEVRTVSTDSVGIKKQAIEEAQAKA